MPVTLPQSVKSLLLDKAYGHVVTSNGEGKPQVAATPRPTRSSTARPESRKPGPTITSTSSPSDS